MNDFTKEELIYLEECLSYSNEEFENPDISYQIHEKIKSMIDNYCEHQEGEEQIVSKAGRFIKCDKCGIFYKE